MWEEETQKKGKGSSPIYREQEWFSLLHFVDLSQYLITKFQIIVKDLWGLTSHIPFTTAVQFPGAPRSALLGNRTVHRRGVPTLHHLFGSSQETAQCFFSYHIPGKFLVFPPNPPSSGFSKLRSRREEFIVLLSDKCCAFCLAKMGDQIPDLHLATIIVKSTPVFPLPAFLSSCPLFHFSPIPHNNLQTKILAC